MDTLLAWLDRAGQSLQRIGAWRTILTLSVLSTCATWWLLVEPLSIWLLPEQERPLALLHTVVCALVLPPLVALLRFLLVERWTAQSTVARQPAGQTAGQAASRATYSVAPSRGPMPTRLTPQHFLAMARAEIERAARARPASHTPERLAPGAAGLSRQRRASDTPAAAAPAANAESHDLCVMLLGVDDFQALTERHGAPFGEQLLQSVAMACVLHLRAHDLFARHGAEEFVALLPATDVDLAMGITDRLRGAIEDLESVSPDGTRVRVTASVGVARLDYDSRSLEHVLAKADQALGEARRAGHNRTELAVSISGA